MTEEKRCPKCDVLLRDDAPSGLCPKCLLQAGFESAPADNPAVKPAESADSPTVKSPVAGTSGFVPPSPADLAPMFPQLEILELLGKGGMGAVYKARQKGLDRLVAVKILPPEVGQDPAFAERFTREARAMARLSHPHIVAIHDFGQTNGQYYFVMEYIDGANLRQVIQAKQLTPTEALAIIPQICEALQYAHDEGIVHRDIKPENILVDKKGRVKIADFGLSKLLHHDQPEASLTGTHQVMGTLRYMAPEQMQGTKSVDHRADIYSLGVVFYELLTGDIPMGRFDPPSQKVQIDVRLDEVVLRALAQEPDKRYQQASDVKSDVEAVSRTAAIMFRKDTFAGAALQEKQGADEPRLSRLAIAGAVWAFLGMLAVVPVLYFIGLNRVWNGTAAPTDLLHDQPPLAFSLFMGALLAIGSGAPIGATIFGAIAIGQIRRSNGKIYGLRLAFADLMFYPLVVLGVITFFGTAILWSMLRLDTPNASHAPVPEILAALAVCFFAGRAAWRMISDEKTEKARAVGTPLVQLRFAVGDASDVARLAKFHFASQGYQLFEEQPDTCVFQRGYKWGGLWETDIRGLYTILTVRTAPASDGKSWVSCDWSVRKLGAWVTRGDRAVLEKEGGGFAALFKGETDADESATAQLLTSESDQDYTRRKLTGPAVALMIAAVVNMLGSMAWAVAFLADAQTLAGYFMALAIPAWDIVIGGFVLLGAAAGLRRGETSAIGDFAIVCSLIIPPGLVIAIPAAILYWVRCEDPRIKRVFQATEAAPATAPSQTWNEWWNRLPRSALRLMHVCCTLIYVVCVLMVFGYRGTSTTSPTDPTAPSSTFAIGQPSPWFEYYNDSAGMGSSIKVLTWSTLVAAVGLAALWAMRKLEQQERGKVHAMWWHYGLWTFMLVLAIAVGTFSGMMHARKIAIPKGLSPASTNQPTHHANEGGQR